MKSKVFPLGIDYPLPPSYPCEPLLVLVAVVVAAFVVAGVADHAVIVFNVGVIKPVNLTTKRKGCTAYYYLQPPK